MDEPPEMTDSAAAEAFFVQHGYTGWKATKRFVGGSHILQPTTTWGGTIGKPRCCAARWAERDYHQCDKAASAQDAAGHPWCGVHSPKAVARRKAVSAERDRVRRARRDYGARVHALATARKEAYPKLVAALREIEAGHNDPRALAREILGALPTEDTTDR